MNYLQTGTEYTELLQSNKALLELISKNPVWQIHDQMFGWIFDQAMYNIVKLYYWPMFMVGIQDDLKNVFDPRTYSICKI